MRNCARTWWCCLSLLAILAARLPAVDDNAILTAARAADQDYQRSFDLLVQDLSSADVATRVQAIRTLSWKQDPAAVPLLLPFLETATRSPAEIIAAAQALSNLGATNAADALRRLLTNPDPQLRTAGYNGLSWMSKIGTGDYMGRGKDDHDPLRAGASINSGRLPIAEATDQLLKGLQFDESQHVRRMCAIALGRIGDRSKAAIIVEALNDGDAGVRRYAAEALVTMHYTPAIPNLLMALEANVAGPYINRCVMLLSGQDFGFDPRANLLDRQAAIEKGFQWWAVNAKNLLQ